MKPENPWKTLTTELKYENPWIRVTESQVISPGGKPGIYGKVHFKNLAIGVVPLDDEGNIWLVRQFRYTLEDLSWEIPEGGGSPQQDPQVAAMRELREETGLKARQWTRIITIHTSNSVCDEIGYVYLAEGLEAGTQELEHTEADLVVAKVPLHEAVARIERGEITDSLSIAGILMTARLRPHFGGILTTT